MPSNLANIPNSYFQKYKSAHEGPKSEAMVSQVSIRPYTRGEGPCFSQVLTTRVRGRAGTGWVGFFLRPDPRCRFNTLALVLTARTHQQTLQCTNHPCVCHCLESRELPQRSGRVSNVSRGSQRANKLCFKAHFAFMFSLKRYCKPISQTLPQNTHFGQECSL